MREIKYMLYDGFFCIKYKERKIDLFDVSHLDKEKVNKFVNSFNSGNISGMPYIENLCDRPLFKLPEKIKIESCKNRNNWYSKYVGEERNTIAISVFYGGLSIATEIRDGFPARGVTLADCDILDNIS